MTRHWPFFLPFGLLTLLIGFILLRLSFDEPEDISRWQLWDTPDDNIILNGFQGGPEFDLSALPSKPALVNIFASWCTPCLLEHPLLMELSAHSNLAIYGIAYQDELADTARFLDRHGNPYQIIGVDRNGLAGLTFGIEGVPETLLIDAEGEVVALWRGPLIPEAIFQINPLLSRHASLRANSPSGEAY